MHHYESINLDSKNLNDNKSFETQNQEQEIVYFIPFSFFAITVKFKKGYRLGKGYTISNFVVVSLFCITYQLLDVLLKEST